MPDDRFYSLPRRIAHARRKAGEVPPRGTSCSMPKLGLQVLPVAVNSGLFWSSTHRHRLPGIITVSHLEPIEPGLKPSEFIRKIETDIDAEAGRLALRREL